VFPLGYVSTLQLACAAVYAALGLLLALHSGRRAHAVLLIAACFATGLWALCAGLQPLLGGARDPALVGRLDLVRVALWIALLAAVAYGGDPAEGARARVGRWPLGGIATLGLAAMLLEPFGETPPSLLPVPFLYVRLALVVGGLVLLEAVVRHAREAHLWRVRYLCLGILAILVYELVAWSDALLFRRIDPRLAASRAAVSLVAAPLVAVAAARNAAWATELRLARRAALHGAALIAVGVYMVALGVAGELMRSRGGEWGDTLSPAFVVAGALALAMLATSPGARTRVKWELGRYLFTYRHDYREQWRRFAETLASESAGASIAARALRALADVLGSSRGGLWLRERDGFCAVAWLGLPEAAPGVLLDARVASRLERSEPRIAALRDDPQAPIAERTEWLPEAMRASGNAWLLVPLVQGGRSIGLVVLSHSPAQRALDREDEELLRSAALHAASYVAAEQAARELEEARRFEALSRGMAFVAHDLRNLANELTLTLANAREHVQKPEFQRDLLLSLEASVARMRRLLDRLSQRRAAPPERAETDLATLLDGSLRGWASGGPALRFEPGGEAPIRVACDPDRLASISGHLVQNAVEAAGPNGRVAVRLHRERDACVLEVEDDGPGMSAEFVRERLRHPFGSSKRNGFGLGLFECRELARQVGGELLLDSAPGRGTVARLRLPLARAEDPTAARRAADG